MTVITWIIGIAIIAWTGAMGGGALLRTDSAQKWFGEMLDQSPGLMTINGIGMLVTAALIALNLLMPTLVTTIFVKWALAGIVIVQLSTLFIQARGRVPGAAMAGPTVLIALAVIYWIIRT